MDKKFFRLVVSIIIIVVSLVWTPSVFSRPIGPEQIDYIPWSQITHTPTTLEGYGITNAISNVQGIVTNMFSIMDMSNLGRIRVATEGMILALPAPVGLIPANGLGLLTMPTGPQGHGGL